MSEAHEPSAQHADLMDGIYRRQRLIYDVTRKYYLFGRDHLIAGLRVPREGTVLEVACGTGRNLRRIGKTYPGAHLYGLDISSEMLTSARATLGADAQLAQADACTFDGQKTFGRPLFDRIVLSYAISMIPDWTQAIETAARHLAPGGSLHIVDFGDQAELPRLFRRGLRAWLSKFHVSPRDDLSGHLARIAEATGTSATTQPLYRRYAVYAVLQKT